MTKHAPISAERAFLHAALAVPLQCADADPRTITYAAISGAKAVTVAVVVIVVSALAIWIGSGGDAGGAIARPALGTAYATIAIIAAGFSSEIKGCPRAVPTARQHHV